MANRIAVNQNNEFNNSTRAANSLSLLIILGGNEIKEIAVGTLQKMRSGRVARRCKKKICHGAFFLS